MPAVADPSMGTDQASVARAIALGRLGLAAAFCLTPGLALRGWPGRGAHKDPVARMLARSVGVRDLALGAGTLMALRHGSPVRGWLEAGVVADLGDAMAVALAAPHVPHARALLAFSSAAGAVVAGQWVIRSLPRGDGSAGNAGGDR